MVIDLDNRTGFDLKEFTVTPNTLLKCGCNFGVRSLQAEELCAVSFVSKMPCVLVSASVKKLMWM